MLTRRALTAAVPLVLAAPASAAPGFSAFLAGVRAEAAARGIAPGVLSAALGGLAPDPKVLKLDRHQPEFTMTWAHYSALLITRTRIDAGRAAYRAHRALFHQIATRFGVAPGPILGIWGLESNYGATTGNFGVVDALATLAWGSGRKTFFRNELIAALRILNTGDITPAQMTGSWAGAMGQPQFMPSAYLHYAVDITGTGRRDIWHSVPDVLASIANYLAGSGWRRGQGWGVPAVVLPGFAGAGTRPEAAWRQLGVVPMGAPGGAPGSAPGGAPGGAVPPGPLALVRPAGTTGPAYLVGSNFAAIRRYNPSDFYALVVGLLGDRIVA